MINNDSPEISPDILPNQNKRGWGVRRLNKYPLAVVGGVVGLAIAGLAYTMHDRQQKNRGVAQARLPEVTTTSVVPISPADALVLEPPTIPIVEEVAAIDPIDPVKPIQPVAPPPPPMTEAMLNRLRLIDRIEQNQIQQHEAALISDGGVQSFSKNQAASASTPTNQDPFASIRAMAAANLMQQAQGAPTNPGIGGFGGGGGVGQDPNRQDIKNGFLAAASNNETYLQAQRTEAISAQNEVKAGTVIPGVMISGINSDLPGQVIAQVRENVYDSATGNQLLVPAGSRLVGLYDSNVSYGQDRVLLGWERIIYPDGSSISIGRMPGSDVAGYAGFEDQVDNHYLRIFASGILLSVFSAGVQLSQPQAVAGENISTNQILAASLGQQMAQIGTQMTEKNLGIQPTIEIRPGYQFNVMVTKDILLPPWTGHPLAK